MVYETDYYVIKKISCGGGYLAEYVGDTWQPCRGQISPDTTCIFSKSYPLTLQDGTRIVDKLNIEHGYGRDEYDIDYGKFVDWVLLHIRVDYDVVRSRKDIVDNRSTS